MVIDDGGAVTARRGNRFPCPIDGRDRRRSRPARSSSAPDTGAAQRRPDPARNGQNDGNAAVSRLPVNLLLLDPGAELELGQWTETIDLERDATASLSAVWNVDVPAGTVLVAALRAEFQGEYRILATATVRVQERFVSDPLLEGRGRLLVLLDPPGREECVAWRG
jgi:hypothetical protein